MEELIKMTIAGWVITAKFRNGVYITVAHKSNLVRYTQSKISLEDAIRQLVLKVRAV